MAGRKHKPERMSARVVEDGEYQLRLAGGRDRRGEGVRGGLRAAAAVRRMPAGTALSRIWDRRGDRARRSPRLRRGCWRRRACSG